MAKKQKYHVSNQKEYNKSLKNRGSLTVWFNQESLDAWNSTERSILRETVITLVPLERLIKCAGVSFTAVDYGDFKKARS